MTKCSHHVCGREKSVWFHTKDCYSSVKKHTYCTTCGVIQNISDDRPKAIGYWMNKLGFLCSELGITHCQKRLIAKEIETNEYFTDSFGSFGSCQKELFKRIVSSHCDTSTIDFDAVIHLSR